MVQIKSKARPKSGPTRNQSQPQRKSDADQDWTPRLSTDNVVKMLNERVPGQWQTRTVVNSKPATGQSPSVTLRLIVNGLARTAIVAARSLRPDDIADAKRAALTRAAQQHGLETPAIAPVSNGASVRRPKPQTNRTRNTRRPPGNAGHGNPAHGAMRRAAA